MAVPLSWRPEGRATKLSAQFTTSRCFLIGRWNSCFDVAVIPPSIDHARLGCDASLQRVARTARMVHLMRHASHLTLSRLLVPVTRLGQFKRSAAA
jgi:hypothetical protein